MGEDQQGPINPDRPLLRLPHVILHEGELHAAVEKLLEQPNFVIDVETTKERAQTNTLLWVGLGGPGRVYLIPVGHPKGRVIKPAHKAKTPACILYPADDPRSKTPLGKPSMRLVEHSVPATYALPPRQLPAHEVLEVIRPLLFSERGKIGHNVKYDLETIAKYYGEIPPGPYHDTILVTHVLDENLGDRGVDYSLKSLTVDHYRPKDPKTFYPNLGAMGIENFGLDEVAVYLAKDLRYCWLRWMRYYPSLVRRGLLPVYDFEMSVYPSLMEIERVGFPIAREALGRVRDELEGRIAEIEKRAWDIAGGQFHLSHTETKRWLMFGDAKYPAFEVTPEGMKTRRPLKSQRLRVLSRTQKENTPQITQAILEYYSDRGNELASLFLEWSMLEKLRGTFVEGIDKLLVPHDGDLPTIHTNFKQHGTTTGRLSATEPNLQQIPRGSTIRDLFVAGPDHALIVADYDQIELRCLAKEAHERTMTRIFNEGLDIHLEAASVAMEIPAEAVTDALRQVGKTLNFATGYGAGPERIAAVAGVSVRKGQQFLDRYYERFSGLEPWKRQVLRDARERRGPDSPPHVIIPPNGRLRRLPDLYNYIEEDRWKRLKAERQAVNAIIQGFASNITKLAMIQLHQDLQPYPARMVLQVHDEIIIRVLLSYVDEVVPVVVDAMSGITAAGKPILGNIPLVVTPKVGYSWGEAKGSRKPAVLL
jgi:DNA polymerase I-like protein with 3'-5' exonuclease and polymerase domains